MTIVIVGGGHAGGSAAAYLRQYGCTEPIEIVGEELLAPYQRPPLSKAWLKGDVPVSQILLRPEAFYGSQKIALHLGKRAVALDRSRRTIKLSDGSEISYRKLILATGSAPRLLPVPGRDLAGVLYLRSKDDADKLKSALASARRLIVIGGGYVGLEVAASARSVGLDVVVVEREPRLLARVASPAISEFFARYHAGKGVEIVLGKQVEAVEATRGAITGVRLNDGTGIPGDVVVVGIGAVPNDQLARRADLPCSDGIVVDARARTADPDIYAIGDCTMRPLQPYGTSGRLESVANANEQAKQAASDICGSQAPAPEPPWFWSDQFDLRLQMAGLTNNAVESSVRGNLDAAKFALVHHDKDGQIVAVEAVNLPAEFMAGKAAMARQRARLA